MNISIIAAVAANGVIGRENKLIWYYPKDMKRFVELTKRSGVVIMGRKTHESIGKLLPGRINIVISNNLNYKSKGALIFNMSEAISFCRRYQKEVMVIGGEKIYREFMPFVSTMYITNINAPYMGDSYFPECNELEWNHVEQENHQQDDRHQYSFTFDRYERIR
jgi:dihydrofolate reductase